MHITNVMAVSLDGQIASKKIETDQERRSYGFTNMDDHNHVRALIQECDAVITGANSLRASQSAWPLKNNKGKYPHWVILTRRGLSSELPFFDQTEIPKTIVSPSPLQTAKSRPNTQHRTWEEANFSQHLKVFFEDNSIEKCLLFGGSEVNRFFYEKNLVDELIITICPIIIAQKGAPELVARGLQHYTHFQLISSQVISDHVFLRYKVKKC